MTAESYVYPCCDHCLLVDGICDDAPHTSPCEEIGRHANCPTCECERCPASRPVAE